jgi:ABC-type Fe3+ transport system substrate-binding protein
MLTRNRISANMNKTSTTPTSYEDFTKPEFKDKIVLTYPNDDDAVLYQFELMYVPHTLHLCSKY